MSILMSLGRKNNLLTPVLSARRTVKDCPSPLSTVWSSWAGYAPISYVMTTGLSVINPRTDILV